jgi:hypothetical protein
LKQGLDCLTNTPKSAIKHRILDDHPNIKSTKSGLKPGPSIPQLPEVPGQHKTKFSGDVSTFKSSDSGSKRLHHSEVSLTEPRETSPSLEPSNTTRAILSQGRIDKNRIGTNCDLIPGNGNDVFHRFQPSPWCQCYKNLLCFVNDAQDK